MKRETLKALEGSIKKWEKIVDGSGGDEGTENCPLCKLYYTPLSSDCAPCPVSKRVKTSCCEETPYVKWNNYAEDRRQPFPFYVTTVKALSLALDELYFLKSLLPGEQE